MKGKIKAASLKFHFDMEEIPILNMEPTPEKKVDDKSKIIIHKKIKNGRDSSANHTELF